MSSSLRRLMMRVEPMQGAVYLFNGSTGDLISTLVGASPNDQVGRSTLVGNGVGVFGIGSVLALENGNYVVRSGFWDNVAATDAGAVTFGDGTSGGLGPNQREQLLGRFHSK